MWHRLLAKLLEYLLSPVKVIVLSELPATSNPPQMDILLLRREGAQWTPEQRALLPDGVRDRQVAHHLLECKITESVTEQSLHQALTYDYLYSQSQQLSADEMQTYVVSAQTPQPAKLAAWGYRLSEHPGVYVSAAPLLHKVVLLVLNELRDAAHNEYFRLFASRQRVRQAALRSLRQEQPAAVWTVVLALQKAYELEGAGMSAEVTLESLLEMGEEMRKQVVASASPAERLAGLALEERLAGLGPEDLQALWQQLDRYLGQQTGPPTPVTAAALQEKHQTLLHVLRHKFGTLPVAIVQRIETTSDADQLNQWLDQALDAASLGAIHFDAKPDERRNDPTRRPENRPPP